MTGSPRLALVLYKDTAHNYFNKVLQCLNAQTIANDLELMIVVEHEQSWQEVNARLIEKIGHVRHLVVGPGCRGDAAYVRALAEVSAPYAARLEDHAYYSADWCESIVDAADSGDWVAIGTRMYNANPDSFWSWASIIYSYGPWLEVTHFGEVDHIMWHNVVFRVESVLRYDAAILEREFRTLGSFLNRLKADDGRFYLCQHGYVAHINPSRASAAYQLRLKTGRLGAYRQVQRNGWSLLRRALTSLATPLFPPLRFIRRYRASFGGARFQGKKVKLLAAYAVQLVIEAFGNAIGYLFGVDGLEEWLVDHETHVYTELNVTDLALLFEGSAVTTRPVHDDALTAVSLQPPQQPDSQHQ